MPTALGDALRRTLVLLAFLTPAAAPAAAAQEAEPAAAQEVGEPPAAGAAAPAASEDQIRRLLEALEDPARREELVARLRTLLEVTGEGEEAPPLATASESAVRFLSEEVSRRTDTVQEVAESVVGSLDQVPFLFTWLGDQATDPDRRAFWLQVGLRLALVLGGGIGAYMLAAVALDGPRRRLRESGPERFGARAVKLLGWLAVELVPVLAFATAAYVALVVVDPRATARLAVEPLILGVLGGRAVIAVARVAFAPKAPGLRPLPLADDTAAHWFRWTRRIAAFGIYGTAILEAGWRLGLPWTIHGFLRHLLYLALAVMAMLAIVRQRERVAAPIVRLAGEEGERRTGLRRLPWQTLANTWHLFAMLFVVSLYAVWALRIPGGFQYLLSVMLGTVAIVTAAWLALDTIARLTEREVSAVEEEPEDEPLPGGAEERANRYLPLAATVGRIAVIAVAALALLQLWGVNVVGWMASDIGRAFGRQLLTMLIIAAVTIGLWEVISLLIQRAVAAKDPAGNLVYSNRARTLLNITRSVVLVFLGLIAVLLVLSEMGVNIAPLLAGAGVIGLAIGFGSQKLVQDIITGMFMLVGDTVRVGDIVQLGGRAGLVEAVNLRTVRLRDYTGAVHTIPYSAIDTVTNQSKDFSFYVFDVGVSYREDVNEVMDVLREIGAEMRRDRYFRRLILEPLEVAGVDRFADSAVMIKARFKTLPLKQWEVGREFNRRLKMRFDELGIEIPFPHQTVYFGADRRGEAPAARVRVLTEGEPVAAGGEQRPLPDALLTEREAMLAAEPGAEGAEAEPRVVGLARRDPSSSSGRRHGLQQEQEETGAHQRKGP
ncbi:MAG TPA: mechanosensitive ion channel domain-containing protein [Geminicoccaceae bacterium]|nr:mechanosensitive ion channel domain-containing protein [Geminicoccaceae bacterium]